ncbi:hypothetical protein [Enterococcus faecium]|uniref:Uncharacterized protein n=1 Tax=Enterococcus faecium TaxID=1352 RepID=A0A9X4B3W7_ENTFC|nr:hypothetical protein [Enterococcus faecium]MDC4248075.1 hypothetical protein [Enterococcus faecium]
MSNLILCFFLFFLLMSAVIEKGFVFKTHLGVQRFYFVFSVCFILVNVFNVFEIPFFSRILYIGVSVATSTVYFPALKQMNEKIKKEIQGFKEKHKS